MPANSDRPHRRGPGRRWEKGCPSPNPSGRPRQPREFVEAARAHSVEALQVVLMVMRKAKHLSTRLRAAEVVLDRAWGRPAMSLSVDLAATRLDLAQVSAAEWEALSILRHTLRPALAPADAAAGAEVEVEGGALPQAGSVLADNQAPPHADPEEAP